jgi:cytidine deaminase
MDKDYPYELFFGIVGYLGNDLDGIIKQLEKILKKFNFKTNIIVLSELLKQFKEYQVYHEKEDERLNFFMNAGDEVRKKMELGEALAILVINKIREIRKTETQNIKPLYRQAFILKSLKHPSEVALLRYIYRSSFYLISVYSPRDSRIDNLARKIMQSHGGIQNYRYRAYAEELIQRDESEVQLPKYGQNVRDTYPSADVFIDTRDQNEVEKSLERFIELIFGNTFHIPTTDEFGMFNAYASARRSGSLARQVGASITNEFGELISTGTNEVPKFRGGHYTTDQHNDTRNSALGYDPNDQKKIHLLADTLRNLKKLDLLKEITDKSINDLAIRIKPQLKNTQIMNLIEFTREVHAEMDAILTASRTPISIRDSILYSTTFPCHDCTKHIVGAGIKKVVYFEPYPKSLASDLYSDFISIDESRDIPNKVKFEPFVGISPILYMEIFEMGERKNPDGTVKDWDSNNPSPRFYEPYDSYLSRELQKKQVLEKFNIMNLGNFANQH